MLSKRIYISLAASLILLIGWYFTFYQPQSSRMRLLKSEQESIGSRLSVAEAQLKQAGVIKTTMEESSDKWDSLRCSLVGPDSVELILGHLMQLAASEELTILNMDISFDPLLDKLDKGEESHHIDRIDVDIAGRGRFFDVGDFVALLEKDVIVADIDNIELVYQQTVDPEIYFDLQLEVLIVPGRETVL
ncbi:MAG: hypothetical protein ABIK83_15345 [Candidatus Zixiibacteriota bacterium]